MGIAEFDVTDGSTLEEATVGFGRDPSRPEFSFVVNPQTDLVSSNTDAPDGATYRKVLLGMKPNSTYYAQVTARIDGVEQQSASVPFDTGLLPNGLPAFEVTDVVPGQAFGGFTVTCTGFSSGESWALIVDQDGDLVWAYPLTGTEFSTCTRARMSMDAKYLWLGNLNLFGTGGALLRVSMDGLETDTFELPGRHHDFAILPDGNILFFAQANGGGGELQGPDLEDVISELDPLTGDVKPIYDQSSDLSELLGDAPAHTNQINYVPELQAISFSMRQVSTIGLVSYPQGQLLALFGGAESTFDMAWDIQHGHQVDRDRLLVFNNNGQAGGASILEYSYALDDRSSSLLFRYDAGISSSTFGDVKRLPNGNIFATYSNSGVFHELDATGRLLRTMVTDSVGYSEHRKTLDGPPPPFDEYP